jgi:hypothetical protein
MGVSPIQSNAFSISQSTLIDSRHSSFIFFCWSVAYMINAGSLSHGLMAVAFAVPAVIVLTVLVVVTQRIFDEKKSECLAQDLERGRGSHPASTAGLNWRRLIIVLDKLRVQVRRVYESLRTRN